MRSTTIEREPKRERSCKSRSFECIRPISQTRHRSPRGMDMSDKTHLTGNQAPCLRRSKRNLGTTALDIWMAAGVKVTPGFV
jgi:hypothetical protein